MNNFIRLMFSVCAALFCTVPTQLCASGNPYAAHRDELKPSDIVVLANSNAPESIALAHYYAEKRQIPEANIVSLPMPLVETVSWDDYLHAIEEPLHAWLAQNGWLKETAARPDEFGRTRGVVVENRVGYVVICQGVPLRVSDDARFATSANLSDFLFIIRRKSGAVINKLLLHSQASVDSELAAMTAEVNPVYGFVPNLIYKNTSFSGPVMLRIIRTARLAGPDYAAARSLIDSAMEAERRGLQGRVYIDKSGPYPLADSWFDSAAKGFTDAGWDVQVDTSKSTFQPGVRFDAPAFYFGWYAKAAEGPFLEPGMRFPAGAIAAHLYSYSAYSLADRKQWCSAFVERGVAGTFGNVFEPTMEFTHDFGIVAEAMLGGWSFCDAAWSAMPVLSWQGVIIGDPLYRPMPWMAEGSKAARPVGEYPAISGILSLQEAGKTKAAMSAAKQAAEDTHGFALSLKYAQMLHAAGRDGDAKEALLFVANTKDMTCDQRSVAIEIARFLGSISEPETALAILENLRSADTSQGFRTAVSNLGYEIAQRSGRAEFIGRWQKDAASAN